MKVTNDKDFEKYVQENYILDDDDNDDASDDATEDDDEEEEEQAGYWSDDDLPVDESEEVLDDMFDMQISFDINDMSLTAPAMHSHHNDFMMKSPPSLPSFPSWSNDSYFLSSAASTDLIYEDTKLPATTSSTGYVFDQESGPLVKPSVASTDLFYEDTKLPAMTSSTGFASDQESGLLVTWCCWVNTTLILNPGFRIASYMRPVLRQLAQRVGQRAAVAKMVIAKTPVDARKIMLNATVGVVAMGTASMGTALAL
jgi:hypothetical protein